MLNEHGKKISILGCGESGIGCALLVQQQGGVPFVSDHNLIADTYKQELKRYGIAFEEGGHNINRIAEADTIIKSPGIAPTTPIIQGLKKRGFVIIGEIEYAAKYTNAYKICITGSNGKSTVSSLVYHTLITSNRKAILAGNIGHSFAKAVATQQTDCYVLELSSFMLDDMIDFKPDIAVLLNISADHLERYNYSLDEYAKSKFQITKNLKKGDVFIYNGDDKEITHRLKDYKIEAKQYSFSQTSDNHHAVILKKKTMIVQQPDSSLMLTLDDLSQKGKHNIYNYMAASIVSKTMEISDVHIRESFRTFSGIPHRLEKVADVSGVAYINDSKATNINSTWYALESMRTPTILILGGIDKGNDYEIIQSLVTEKVKAIICLGIDNEKIIEFFNGIVPQMYVTDSMRSTIKLAHSLAQKGDTVLLSPACSSFDLFQNYEDRGNQFKEEVFNL